MGGTLWGETIVIHKPYFGNLYSLNKSKKKKNFSFSIFTGSYNYLIKVNVEIQ